MPKNKRVLPVKVRKTRIGHGVFAKKKFKKHELIGEVDGRIIKGTEYGSDYCIDFGEDLSLEPGEPFRYMNHSCHPNCVLVTVDEPDSRHGRVVVVEAVRKISKGDELSIDYAWPAEFAIPCLCASSQCRGWIVEPTELDSLLQKNLAT